MPTKLRVLLCTSDTFPPWRVDVSVLFGRELSSRGHQIDLLLQSDNPIKKAYTTDWGGGNAWVGTQSQPSSWFKRLKRLASYLLHDLKIFQILRQTDYDLVIVKDKFISALSIYLAAHLSGVPVVFWLSWPFPEQYIMKSREKGRTYRQMHWIRGIISKVVLYRILLPRSAHVFVQSEQMKEDVAKNGIARERMTAVPMGIDEAEFANESFRCGSPTSVRPPSVLYLGTLAKFRRLDFLVRVLQLVQQRVPEVKLYFVGAGTDEADEEILSAEARRLDVMDAIEFVGQLPRAIALTYVQSADVCVSPFFPNFVLRSTSPTKLIEYMAMGRPVVVNDHPEQRLIIEQSGAGYSVPWDEECFAEAVTKLLLDRDGAECMGRKGRSYVMAKRTYSQIADLVEDRLSRFTSSAH